MNGKGNILLLRLIFEPIFYQMAGTRTFTMIKPDAVQDGYIGAILEKINGAGFRI